MEIRMNRKLFLVFLLSLITLPVAFAAAANHTVNYPWKPMLNRGEFVVGAVVPGHGTNRQVWCIENQRDDAAIGIEAMGMQLTVIDGQTDLLAVVDPKRSKPNAQYLVSVVPPGQRACGKKPAGASDARLTAWQGDFTQSARIPLNIDPYTGQMKFAKVFGAVVQWTITDLGPLLQSDIEPFEKNGKPVGCKNEPWSNPWFVMYVGRQCG